MDAEKNLFEEIKKALNSKEPPPLRAGEARLDEYWPTVRLDYLRAFDDLAVHGQLSKSDAEWATDTFKIYAVIEPDITIANGRAEIRYVPTFPQALDLEPKIAYALLRLSSGGIRFGACRKCGDLWFDLRPGGGRKRENFCSLKCRNAFHQHEYQLRERAKKGAKHK